MKRDFGHADPQTERAGPWLANEGFLPAPGIACELPLTYYDPWHTPSIPG